MERISNSRLGRLILGDNPVSPVQTAADAGQGSAIVSVGVGERSVPQPAQHASRSSGPNVYEGVPVAGRPRHQQISCETCNQGLEPDQRQVKCHVCQAWMHDGCVEVLHMGSKWNADMCLTCQQTLTRQLKVISAIELKKGHHWDQDEWCKNLQEFVRVGTGYGESRNRDLNELELTLGRALQSGLHCYGGYPCGVDHRWRNGRN